MAIMENEKKGGVQPHEHRPTESSRIIVADLYAAGIPQDRIAKHLNIDGNTLRKHYRAQLDENKDRMVSGMVKNLYQDALNGDKKDREFWLKTIGRLSFAQPVQQVVHTSDASLIDHVNKRGIDVPHGTSDEGDNADAE